MYHTCTLFSNENTNSGSEHMLCIGTKVLSN